MLLDLALIFLVGIGLSGMMRKLHLPELIGMLLTGIVLGVSGLAVFSEGLYEWAPTMRQIALVIILLRAGLQLDLHKVKASGLSAFLLSFVPALFEIATIVVVGGIFFQLSLQDGLIIGCIVAAVSPAIIVPRMLRLLESKSERVKGIATMLLSAASFDDVVVLVLFSAVTRLDASIPWTTSLIQVPIAILLGIGVGIMVGKGMVLLFQEGRFRDTTKVLIMLSVSFLLLVAEEHFKAKIPYAALLSVLAMGAVLFHQKEALALRLSRKYNSLWVGAELLLFVSIGASLQLSSVNALGVMPYVLIGMGLLLRCFATYLCVLPAKLNRVETVFCIVSFMPKATVQAALGSLPLALGFAIGESALSIAVLSILISAPLGAIAMDWLIPHLES
ncbi:MAG: cation:proton antiporter [Erysipelotrichaceae bacterium]